MIRTHRPGVGRGGSPPPGLFQEPSLYTIKAVFILDNDGHRLLAKYYDDTFSSSKEQMTFEKNVFDKTSRAESEIAFLGGLTVVYKSNVDLFLYVVGSSQENELMLMSVLTCLFESLSHILRRDLEKQWLLENLDGAFLVLDEVVDGGVIMESDPQQVVQKVNFRADDSGLAEQSVAQVLQSAKEQIKWSLLK
ncbi:coatomer subunit zeta-2 [Fukomys damarensis]|uniref:coatomer subunit zeta-2 n=1 Tax=Fukomys damarensis TaxID=885580 RepID=UPI0014554AF6|nr:coatomer subunit zeta-2 [Fukomys damarensis]